MIVRLCQLKTLSICGLIFISGCSLFTSKEEKVERATRNFKVSWFKENSQHSLFDQSLEPKAHLFLDGVTSIDPETRKVEVFIETPAHSENIYQIDPVSGQRHYVQSTCGQRDVWGSYAKSIEKNHFSIGVIPRFYDQLSTPQKVIIFGLDHEGPLNFNTATVRLVSAIVVQVCIDSSCGSNNSWLSRLVYIAVADNHPKYADVTENQGLLKVIDWPYTKATLENMYGVAGSLTNPIGKVKVGQPLVLAEALDYSSKRQIKLEEASLKKVQKGCHSLYDKFWKDVGEERLEDRATKTVEELNTKLKHIEKLKSTGKQVGFNHRLRKFIEKYHDQFITCQKLVYAGNINEDVEKFWFLNFMGIFFRLHSEGHHFDCRAKAWRLNGLNKFGNPMFSLKEDISECSNSDIDAAFNLLGNYLSTLKREGKDHYRFIDYDNGVNGTHEKIYRWIKFPAPIYTCKNDPNKEILKRVKEFPEDAIWKQRDSSDVSNREKIIE